MEDRLLKLLDTEQLTSAKFADAIGVQRSSVSHILSGRNKPSFDFLQKTLKVFPMLNADWLILGEGNMYEGTDHPVSGSLFDQFPAGKMPETPQSVGSTAVEENDQDDLTSPGVDISANTHIGPEKSNPAGVKMESGDGVYGKESLGAEDGASDNQLENGAFMGLGGKNSKTISRVIVFYTDKTFESYEKGD